MDGHELKYLKQIARPYKNAKKTHFSLKVNNYGGY